jgi:hypothetical protein
MIAKINGLIIIIIATGKLISFPGLNVIAKKINVSIDKTNPPCYP